MLSYVGTELIINVSAGYHARDRMDVEIGQEVQDVIVCACQTFSCRVYVLGDPRPPASTTANHPEIVRHNLGPYQGQSPSKGLYTQTSRADSNASPRHVQKLLSERQMDRQAHCGGSRHLCMRQQIHQHEKRTAQLSTVHGKVNCKSCAPRCKTAIAPSDSDRGHADVQPPAQEALSKRKPARMRSLNRLVVERSALAVDDAE